MSAHGGDDGPFNPHHEGSSSHKVDVPSQIFEAIDEETWQRRLEERARLRTKLMNKRGFLTSTPFDENVREKKKLRKYQVSNIAKELGASKPSQRNMRVALPESETSIDVFAERVRASPTIGRKKQQYHPTPLRKALKDYYGTGFDSPGRDRGDSSSDDDDVGLTDSDDEVSIFAEGPSRADPYSEGDPIGGASSGMSFQVGKNAFDDEMEEEEDEEFDETQDDLEVTADAILGFVEDEQRTIKAIKDRISGALGLGGEGGQSAKTKKPQPPRQVYIGMPALNSAKSFRNNYISTTKYRPWTFIFKNLFEQFRRVANLYFLVIACITLTPISPVRPGAFILALTVILSANAVKEAIEDWRRYISDKRLNNRECLVLSYDAIPNDHQGPGEPPRETTLVGSPRSDSPHWRRTKWKHVVVGDIVAVMDKQPFPADLVLLSSSDPNGQAYIETSNLDGETNLKVRQAAACTMHARTTEDLLKLRGKVEVEAPNPKLYQCDGYVALKRRGWSNGDVHDDDDDDHAADDDGIEMERSYAPMEGRASPRMDEKTPLSADQLLLRGSILRNTRYIFGSVVFTGHESKFMLNTTATPSKRSRLEKLMNRLIIASVAFELLLCFGSVAGHLAWLFIYADDAWYLDLSDTSTLDGLWSGFLAFFTFLVLYSPMVPISLYVTIEFVRVGQAWFINNDPRMVSWSPALQCWQGASARTSNLNEELGQVEYIFSDKTGTLTRNQMIFRTCAIGGELFGCIPSLGLSTSATSAGRVGGALSLSRDDEPYIIDPDTLDALRTMQDQAGGSGAHGAPHDERTEDVGARSDSFRRDGVEPQEDSHDGERGVADPEEEHEEDEEGGMAAKFMFRDEALSEVLVSRRHRLYAKAREFFAVLAVCHSVQPESQGRWSQVLSEFETRAHSDAGVQERVPSDALRSVEYQASSPDELALVEAARQVGFVFFKRSVDRVCVSVMGRAETYEILNVLPFTSERRRMSVVVRAPSGALKLFIKGADSVIVPRLRRKESRAERRARRDTIDWMMEMAKAGLRTLVVARRILMPEAYRKWNERFEEASTSLSDRERNVAIVANIIEGNLELLGATGIEDRLQRGVPEAIQHLCRAGVKVWVLTGDKQETAVNIAQACNLCPAPGEGHIIVLDEPNERQMQRRLARVVRVMKQDERDRRSSQRRATASGGGLRRVPLSRRRGASSAVVPRHTIVLSGNAMSLVVLPSLQALFLEATSRCKSVVCCRATPLQKTMAVKLVKRKVGCVTLAIGDGANDVSMIQAADVGVGISGNEGMQAVLASDYAVGQFRFLTSLMLVHGRFNYKRLALLVLYFFYKNYLVALIQLWWSMHTGFSGQTIYDGVSGILFNLAFTALPIFVVAMTDRDVADAALDLCPALYREGQSERTINMLIYFRWLVSTVFASLCVFFFPAYLLSDTWMWGGRQAALWEVSTTVYTCAVVVSNVKLAMETYSWSTLFHVTMWPTLISWFLFVLVYCSPLSLYISSGHMLYVMYNLYALPMFWAILLITCVSALLPDFVWKYYTRNYHPQPFEVVQEMMDPLTQRVLRAWNRLCGRLVQAIPALGKLETVRPSRLTEAVERKLLR